MTGSSVTKNSNAVMINMLLTKHNLGQWGLSGSGLIVQCGKIDAYQRTSVKPLSMTPNPQMLSCFE